MPRFLPALGGAAVLVIAAVVGLSYYANQTGVGELPTQSPTATPRSDPEGVLVPGAYAIHPLAVVEQAEPNDLTVTFSVPDGWQFRSNVLAPGPAEQPYVGPPGGMSIEFIDVLNVYTDPCTGGSVPVGPEVGDLLDALRAQTAYEVSEPIPVTIGGYSGQRVDIVMPTEPFVGETGAAPSCAFGRFKLFGATALNIQDGMKAQGPANRWQTNILDVEGTRLVIAATDFPGTTPADRAEMDAILDSIVIQP